MSNATVLIVEDDPKLREMYTDAFTIAGITVLSTGLGAEGVTLALTHHPDAILMDIMLPGMNGHEAVSKIRLDRWGRNATIIYLTNLSDAENVAYAVGKGSSEYIVKANTPPKEVVNKVRMAMRA